MNLPDFLIIGAGKSGSTSLYYYLSQHPQVFMCVPKEPKFFAAEDLCKNFKGPGDQKKAPIDNFEDYKKLFLDAGDAKAIGEGSVIYLYSQKACVNIKNLIPDVKMIAIFRNPIYRAFSNYKQLRFVLNLEPYESFIDALKDEDKRVSEWHPRWHYISRGFYYKQLKTYFEYFDQDQFLLLFYDDFLKDPQKELIKIFNFLEVDNSFNPDTIKWHYKSLIDVKVSYEAKEFLSKIYKEDVFAFSELVKRDLSHWLT